MSRPRVRRAAEGVPRQLILASVGEHATIKRPDLRSRTQQDGIQGLEERWKRKVDDHNMLFALKRDLCYAMHEAGRPFVRESPWAPPDEQLFPAQLFVADHYITVAMCKALNA